MNWPRANQSSEQASISHAAIVEWANTFDYNAELEKVRGRFELGASIEAVCCDFKIACINKATAEYYKAHGKQVALKCAKMTSPILCLSLPELGFPKPAGVLRDGKSFLTVWDIYRREHGIHCKREPVVPFTQRKRYSINGKEQALSELPASLRECRAEAARLLGRSVSTVERQELNFRKALEKWVLFDQETGFFYRPAPYGYALRFSFK